MILCFDLIVRDLPTADAYFFGLNCYGDICGIVVIVVDTFLGRHDFVVAVCSNYLHFTIFNILPFLLLDLFLPPLLQKLISCESIDKQIDMQDYQIKQ